MRIDHIAYLVKDTSRFIKAISHSEHEILIDREPLTSQKAFITMVRVDIASPLIEIVEPFESNRQMLRRLQSEGAESVLYHMGFVVSDFEAALFRMRKEGWLPLTRPFEGFHPGCRACHLYNPSFGILEIMEEAL